MRNRRIVRPRKPARIKIPRFPAFEPRRSTYTAHFVGGEFDGKSLAMYGKTNHEPRPYIDFAEHKKLDIIGCGDGHNEYMRFSNFYVLAEPVKRVGVGCPAFIYQYQPDFVPPSKQETPSFA